MEVCTQHSESTPRIPIKRTNSGLYTPPATPQASTSLNAPFITPSLGAAGVAPPVAKRPRIQKQDSFDVFGSEKLQRTPPPNTHSKNRRDDNDPFAAPINGKLYLGQGLPGQPKRDQMAYVFRGKKVQVNVPSKDDDSDFEREFGDIKPKLLFPSKIPSPPAPSIAAKAALLQTPKKAPASKFGLVPPTPQSLERKRKSSNPRSRKFSDSMDIDGAELASVTDLFGATAKERMRREMELARRAGGQQVGF